MKKILIAAFFFGIAISSKAQQYKYKLADVLVSSITVQEGQNSLLTKHGQGTLQFMVAGTRIYDIKFIDAAGKVHSLNLLAANTIGVPKPDCKSDMTCFASENKEYGVCICKPAPGSQLGQAEMTFMCYTGADRYSIKNFKLGQ